MIKSSCRGLVAYHFGVLSPISSTSGVIDVLFSVSIGPVRFLDLIVPICFSFFIFVLSFFLGCRFAPTGNRFCAWHTLHSTTRTSAQGFLPPRLKFSILLDEVLPGIKMALQRLQMECLTSCDSRICDFIETDCR